MKDVIEMEMNEELYAKVMDFLSNDGEEPEFPLYFTSDSVRFKTISEHLGFPHLYAIFTFNLGKRDNGQYWSDYLFDYYKSKLEWDGDYYDIPTEVAKQIPIFFNGCRVTWVSESPQSLDEITKENFLLDLEENFPPLDGYRYDYPLDTVRIYWKEDGIMEALIAVTKI